MRFISSLTRIRVALSLRGHLCPWQSPAMLRCHCEGACTRGNPIHGASKVAIPFSWLRLPRSFHSLAMTTPARHCEAIYCRSNPIHGTRKVATPFSWLRLPRSVHSLAMTTPARHCEGTQCPRQSHTWSKYGCYTFLMAEIAALVALARNDIITRMQLCVYVMSKNSS